MHSSQSMRPKGLRDLALAGLKTWVTLVNDVNTAATADNFTALLAQFRSLQRVTNLHGSLRGHAANSNRGSEELRGL